MDTAGLQFNKTGFDQKIKYVCCYLYVVKQLNPNWIPAEQLSLVDSSV